MRKTRFKKAGRMPALQGKRRTANERRQRFLHVKTLRLWRTGAQAGMPVLLKGRRFTTSVML